MNNLWCTNYSSVRTNTRFTVLFANTGFFACFNCLPFSLRNHFSKKTFFRNGIRAPKSLDPDQVPYFGGPDQGSKCLQSRRYHAQS